MRYLILLSILFMPVAAHAACFSPETCTADSASIYLGGAPWDVRCALEPSSWDPQVQSYTCIAHSQSLDTSGGVGYVEMEYATMTAAGSVWPYLPNWVTYWWPTKQSATATLTAWSMVDDIATLQDARITWTYHHCSMSGWCEGFINYNLDPGAYYIYCSWYWSDGQILPNVTCRVGQGSMR